MIDGQIILEVSAINRRICKAILSDGQEVDITTWLDADGECGPDGAYSCVCGPDFDGNWYSVNLSQFEAATIN